MIATLLALLLCFAAFGDTFKFAPCVTDAECEAMEAR